MVEAEAAQAPTLEESEGFEALSDDLVLRTFLRAPFVCHGTLHAVCARFKSLLRSDDFRKQRLESGLAEYGVVLAGGVDLEEEENVLADCRMWTNGRWRPIAPMSGPRCGACSVIIDNEMWVMGGVDDDRNALATVEVYSPKTNSWRSCTPMSQRRYGAVAGVVGGRLVVAGGYGDGRFLSSAEAYTGTGWTPLPPMPHEAWLATACVLNGRLYVMGGEGSNKLQVLEMTEENGLSWSCKADLPAIRVSAASVVHEGRVWVMGGYLDGEVESASVITNGAEADAWGTAPQLPSPCAGSSAAVMDGDIFVCHESGVYKYGAGYGAGVGHGGAWQEGRAGAMGRAEFAACEPLLLG